MSFALQNGTPMSRDIPKRNIRLAGKDDLNVILDILNRTNRAFYKRIVPKERFRDPFVAFDDLVAEFRRKAFYLYEMDGEPVGIVAFSTRPRGVAVVDRLYVLPDFHRQGIGSALMASMESLASEQGLSEVLIWTDPKAVWAVSFYERLGYSKVDPGTRFGDPFIDSRIAQHPTELLVLHKRLTGGGHGG